MLSLVFMDFAVLMKALGLAECVGCFLYHIERITQKLFLIFFFLNANFNSGQKLLSDSHKISLIYLTGDREE